MSKGHLQTHVLHEGIQSASLQARPSTSVDGFLPVVMHFSGYSIVVIFFYGFCSIGFTGPNLTRYRRLGSLLRSLQLPWAVVGDWNVSPQALAASGFLQQVGGEIRCADVEYTCDPGGGRKPSHLDFVVHCAAARAYISQISAVHDVPWKPHLALRIHFVSEGEQLLTRIVDLPRRLPSVARPAQAPTPGSKSSLARAKRAEQAAKAAERKEKLHSVLVGDILLPSASEETDGQSTCADGVSDTESRAGGFESEEDPWADESVFQPCPVPAQAPSSEENPTSASAPSSPKEAANADGNVYVESHSAQCVDNPRPAESQGKESASNCITPEPSFDVPLELWNEHRTQIGLLLPHSTRPAAAAASSVAFLLKPDISIQLGQLYGSWAAAVEATIHAHHSQAFLGGSRAEGPEFRVVPVREQQGKRSAALRDFSSSWRTRHRLLGEHQDSHGRGGRDLRWQGGRHCPPCPAEGGTKVTS